MGLLDIFGQGFEDPKSQAIMALSAGLMGGTTQSMSKGLLNSNAAFNDARDRQLQQEQLARKAALQDEELNNARADRAYKLQQRDMEDKRKEGFKALYELSGGNIEQLVKDSIGAGYTPTEIGQLAQVMKLGQPERPKVARTIDTVGLNGQKMTIQLDDSGRQVGAAFAGYEKPERFSDGQNMQVWNPGSMSVRPLAPMQQSPDSIASNARQAQTQAAATTKNNTDLANQYRDDYRAETKDFALVGKANALVQQTANTPNPTGASDIAMVFAYMKSLDPTSVVREGEFATAKNSGGAEDSVRAMYNAVLNGQKLTPEIRKSIAAQSQAAYDQAEAAHVKSNNVWIERSKRNGVNPADVIPGYAPEGSTQGNPSQPNTGGTTGSPKAVRNELEYKSLKSGTRYLHPDGTVRTKP